MNGKSRESADWQNEAVMREIEEIYNLLLESTSDGIYALDSKWRCILANGAAERFTGMPKEELIGKKITEILPGIEKTKFFETFNRVMNTKKAEVISDVYTFQDGRKGWYEVRVYPSPRGILCVSRDITEQKDMEKKLRESEETARMMLNATHDMAIMVGWDGTIVDLNDALAKSFGRNKNELIGKNLRDILPKDVFERRHSHALGVKSTKKPVQFEDERNGRWFDNRLYPVFDEKGEVCMVADFIQDITERRNLDQQLIKSRETARMMLNATHDMVALADFDGTIVDLNDSLAELLGMDKRKLVGRNFRDILKNKVFEDAYSCAMEVKRTKKPFHLEYEQNGRWFDNLFYPVFDEKGEVCRIADFIQDITERKKVEEALRESRETAQMLLNATHDMVLLLEWDATILDMNDSMAKSLGVNKKEAIGKNLREYLPPEIFESRYSHAMETKKTGKPARLIDERAGKYFDNIFYPIFDGNGEVFRFAVFSRDITEQRMAEEALKESEEKFRTVVENAGEGIGIVDENENFIFTNPEAEEIFGVGRGELDGRNIMDFLSDEEKKKVLRQTEKRRGGEKSTYELEIVRPNGRKRIIEATVSPRFDQDGQYTGAFGVFRDITKRRAMEDEIREREERHRKLMKTLPDAVTMTDLEGNITYASKRTLEIHGFENEDNILGMNSLDFIVPEEHEKAMDNIRRTLETGFVRNVEYTLLRKDGSKFTGLLSASVIKDADGNPEAFIGVTRDITDRKKAEDEARRLSQFRESIIDNANVWLDVLDEKGNIVIWNRAAENISGYSAEEVVGHGKIWEWLYPDENYRKQITEKAAAIIQKGEVVEDFETTIRCKDGKIKVISWNSRNLLGSGGKPMGSIALGRDVTARRQAEEELMKFKTVADNARYGVAIADINGTVWYVNEYYANVHGYRVEEVVGSGISLFYNDEQFREVTKLRKRLFEEESVGIREIWHSRRDGSVFPMMMSAVVIKGEGGRPEYLAVNALDITEYKRMEKEISQKDKMAALGRIASVVSHELNTPLANIGVTAEYLSSKLSGEYEEELKIIMSEVDNASDIIKRILNFSRMDNLELREVDIGEVVVRAVEAVRAKRRTDAIETEVERCMVMGDEYRLFEVMMNILDNAVLAWDSLKEKHTIKVKSRMLDDSAVITVMDNGVGMDASVAEKASQPFFTTRAKGEGVGLGLFIAKWIVDEHGGNLYIESEKDVGTKVTVTIPCVGGKNERYE